MKSHELINWNFRIGKNKIPQMIKLENHRWRIWKTINEEIGKSQMNELKFQKWKTWNWKYTKIKKMKNSKWRRWKTINEEIEIPQMNKLKFHKWKKWNSANK